MFSRVSSVNALAPSPNDTAASTKTALSQSKTAFSVPKETPSLAKPPTCKWSLPVDHLAVLKLRSGLTGEEDETIEAELKGVKLFIKRGRKEFTDGMYGHVKILAQKGTPKRTTNENTVGTDAENNSRTRLRKSLPSRTLRHRSLSVLYHPFL